MEAGGGRGHSPGSLAKGEVMLQPGIQTSLCRLAPHLAQQRLSQGDRHTQELINKDNFKRHKNCML